MARREQGQSNAGGVEDADFAGHRCLAAFLVLLVLSSLAFTAVPGSAAVVEGVAAGAPGGLQVEGDDLVPLVRDGVLAVAGLAAAAFALRGSLRASGCLQSASGAENRGAMRRSSRRVTVALMTLAVLGVAAGWFTMVFEVGLPAGGAGFCLRWGDGGATVAGVLTLLLLCLFTGVYEEALFRPLLIGALMQSGPRVARRPWVAAAVSALLFGLMHVAPALPGGSFGCAVPLEAALPVARFVQTAAFGFLMAELFMATGSFWLVAIAHGLFDLLLFGPTFLAGGFVPTYAAPTLGIVAVVVASALVLIVLCAVVLPMLKGANYQQQCQRD